MSLREIASIDIDGGPLWMVVLLVLASLMMWSLAVVVGDMSILFVGAVILTTPTALFVAIGTGKLVLWAIRRIGAGRDDG